MCAGVLRHCLVVPTVCLRKKSRPNVTDVAQKIIVFLLGGHFEFSLSKLKYIKKDSTYPGYLLFTLFLPGRCFCSIGSKTDNFRDSYYHFALREMNATARWQITTKFKRNYRFFFKKRVTLLRFSTKSETEMLSLICLFF